MKVDVIESFAQGLLYHMLHILHQRLISFALLFSPLILFSLNTYNDTRQNRKSICCKVAIIYTNLLNILLCNILYYKKFNKKSINFNNTHTYN